jgi:hypothetical protein
MKPIVAAPSSRLSKLRFLVGFLGLALSCQLFPACSTGGTGERTTRNRNLITLEELAPFAQLSAYEAVQQLRPRWLTADRAVNVRGSGHLAPRLIVDGMPRGPLEGLRAISVHSIEEIRFMNSSDATTRFGTGYAAGAIEVITRS